MYARDRFPDTKKRFFNPGQCWGVIATERRRNRRIGAPGVWRRKFRRLWKAWKATDDRSPVHGEFLVKPPWASETARDSVLASDKSRDPRKPWDDWRFAVDTSMSAMFIVIILELREF
jgi:hypothetical protein